MKWIYTKGNCNDVNNEINANDNGDNYDGAILVKEIEMVTIITIAITLITSRMNLQTTLRRVGVVMEMMKIILSENYNSESTRIAIWQRHKWSGRRRNEETEGTGKWERRKWRKKTDR